MLAGGRFWCHRPRVLSRQASTHPLSLHSSKQARCSTQSPPEAGQSRQHRHIHARDTIAEHRIRMVLQGLGPASGVCVRHSQAATCETLQNLCFHAKEGSSLKQPPGTSCEEDFQLPAAFSTQVPRRSGCVSWQDVLPHRCIFCHGLACDQDRPGWRRSCHRQAGCVTPNFKRGALQREVET